MSRVSIRFSSAPRASTFSLCCSREEAVPEMNFFCTPLCRRCNLSADYPTAHQPPTLHLSLLSSNLATLDRSRCELKKILNRRPTTDVSEGSGCLRVEAIFSPLLSHRARCSGWCAQSAIFFFFDLQINGAPLLTPRFVTFHR